MKQALDGLGLVWDVRMNNVPEIPRVSRDGKDPYVNQSATNPEWYEGGNRQFTYIHKFKAGADIYFIANSSAQTINADLTLRGRLKLQAWDPHSGKLATTEYSHNVSAGNEITQLKMTLDPLKTVFFVSEPIHPPK